MRCDLADDASVRAQGFRLQGTRDDLLQRLRLRIDLSVAVPQPLLDQPHGFRVGCPVLAGDRVPGELRGAFYPRTRRILEERRRGRTGAKHRRGGNQGPSPGRPFDRIRDAIDLASFGVAGARSRVTYRTGGP